MVVAIKFKFDRVGPAFERPGVVGLLTRALDGAIRDLVEEGEQRLDVMLRPRPGGVYLSVAEAGRSATKGNYRRNVSGRAQSGSGVITDGGVVYGPWLEGVGRRNLTTRFKGYGAFRKVGAELDRSARRVLDRRVQRELRKVR